MKARKRIEAVITGTIGNRVVFTGSGVRIPSLPPNKTNGQIIARSFCFDVAERGFERVGSRLANDAIYNNKSKPTKQPMKRLFATPA